MIRNVDGSPYQVSGTLQVFNPSHNGDRDLLNSYDAEIIKINGTPIYYYEYLADANSIDPLYNEARGALYSPNYVVLYAYYDPITSQNYQNMFGIDSPNTITFELNYDATVQAIGHMPRVGSRLYTPPPQGGSSSNFFGQNWEIIQRGAADWKLWGQIRMILECGQFQESKSRQGGKVTEKAPPPYTIN